MLQIDLEKMEEIKQMNKEIQLLIIFPLIKMGKGENRTDFNFYTGGNKKQKSLEVKFS